jgi:hypothetical protein
VRRPEDARVFLGTTRGIIEATCVDLSAGGARVTISSDGLALVECAVNDEWVGVIVAGLPPSHGRVAWYQVHDAKILLGLAFEPIRP